MKRKKLVWGLLSLSLALTMGACSNDDDNNSQSLIDGYKNVGVKNLGVEFGDLGVTAKSIVAATAETKIDGYTVEAKLIEEPDVTTRSKKILSRAKAITFYDNALKESYAQAHPTDGRGRRYQDITSGNMWFEVPAEEGGDGCTIIFYAHGDGTDPGSTMTETLSAPKNVCWTKETFSGVTPTTTLSDVTLTFTPLFAQIVSFLVDKKTSGGEDIASVSDVKLTAGSTNTAKITIAKTGVTLSDVGTTNDHQPTWSITPGTANTNEVDIIPNGKDMAVTLKITIGSTTKTANIDFKTKAKAATRYSIHITVKKAVEEEEYSITIKDTFEDKEATDASAVSSPSTVITTTPSGNKYINIITIGAPRPA